MSIVVICVDGLPVHLLGAYGNSLFDTPAIDTLAARGFVLERAFATGDMHWRQAEMVRCLNGFVRAGFQVTRFAGGENRSEEKLEHTETELFQTIELLQAEIEKCAEDWTETGTAIFVGQVVAHLDRMNLTERHCIWIDLPLMLQAWDAPIAWRDFLSGDDDPDVLTLHHVPQLSQADPTADLQTMDPDERLVWEQAASAQVMLLDRCVEVIADWLADAWPETALLLTASQGFSLGEHGSIAANSASVHAEVMQVPFLISCPEQSYSIRVPGVQSKERWLQSIAEIMSEPSGVSMTERVENLTQEVYRWSQYSLFRNQLNRDLPRNAVMSWSKGEVAIRTNHWSFIWKRDIAVQLYVGPDDRFEQNDVADRCRSLANLFLRNVAKFGACLFTHLPPAWWLDADETLPIDSDAENLASEIESDSHDGVPRAGLDLLPVQFWMSAI